MHAMPPLRSCQWQTPTLGHMLRQHPVCDRPPLSRGQLEIVDADPGSWASSSLTSGPLVMLHDILLTIVHSLTEVVSVIF